MCKGDSPVATFNLDDHIVKATLGKPFKCSIHGDIEIMHMAPDLVRLCVATYNISWTVSDIS